jgi:hypothetical protein
VAGQQCQEHLHLSRGQRCTQAVPVHTTTQCTAAAAATARSLVKLRMANILCVRATAAAWHGSRYCRGMLICRCQPS